MLFGDKSDIQVDNPIRRFEKLFHGSAELLGTVTMESTKFMREFKDEGGVLMHAHDEGNYD